MRDDPAMRERALDYMNEALRQRFAQSDLVLAHPRRAPCGCARYYRHLQERPRSARDGVHPDRLRDRPRPPRRLGCRDKSARLLIEAALRGNTNELLIASVGTVTGSNLPPDRKPTADDVRSAIDEWARHVREQFDRIWQDERPEAG